METKTLLVRLKPYNPKRGFVLKSYTLKDVRFVNEKGWYRVDAALAEELRDIHQLYGDTDSPLAFDVCTEEEAKAIDEREADAATVRKTAEKSNVITDVSTKAPAAPVVTTDGGDENDDDDDVEDLNAPTGEGGEANAPARGRRRGG